VVDLLGNRIEEFNSSGVFLTTWGSPGGGDGQFYYPHAVAFDAAGNVYVTDGYNNRVQKFTAAGVFLSTWGSAGTGDGQFQVTHGVAVDTAGNVYVVSRYNCRIQVFSPVSNPPPTVTSTSGPSAPIALGSSATTTATFADVNTS